MFKHILVATDGSKLSMKAVRSAAKLAGEMKARLTALYVAPETPTFYGEGSGAGHEILERQFREAAAREAKKTLAEVEIEAKTGEAAAYESKIVHADHPWREIVRLAEASKCDLIVMASHGRKGIEGLILGSETVKVLTHTKIPVLVCR